MSRLEDQARTPTADVCKNGGDACQERVSPDESVTLLGTDDRPANPLDSNGSQWSERDSTPIDRDP